MDERFVLALAGGVGGGKLARGLTAVLPPERLAYYGAVRDSLAAPWLSSNKAPLSTPMHRVASPNSSARPR